MSGFSAEWLALREPADHDARSPRLVREVAAHLRSHTGVHAVDLGSGAGSNVRYLLPRLEAAQQWLLTDSDEALIAAARRTTIEWGQQHGYRVDERGDLVSITANRTTSRLRWSHLDLARPAELPGTAFDDAFRELPSCNLVTASALLDLVSDEWLHALVSSCRQRSIATLLFALTYDGRIAFTPEEREDDMVRILANEHQHRDKGFGAALGPDAVAATCAHLRAAGYEVQRERSDWVLPESARLLQGQLIDGWAQAASEAAPPQTSAIAGWARRRQEHIQHARSRIIVGHEDVAAVLR